MKMLSLLAGAAFLATAGLAQAGEPVKLTEAQMDKVSAGAYYHKRFPNVAVAYADALAFGKKTYTETSTFTETTKYSSYSSSYSTSVTY